MMVWWGREKISIFSTNFLPKKSQQPGLGQEDGNTSGLPHWHQVIRPLSIVLPMLKGAAESKAEHTGLQAALQYEMLA